MKLFLGDVSIQPIRILLAALLGAAAWDDHGYYEIALDAGTLTLSP